MSNVQEHHEDSDFSYDGKSRVNRLDNSTRIAHISTILPFTYFDEKGNRLVDPFWLFHDAAAWVAAKDFNERNPRIVKDLLQHTQGCDVKLVLKMHDTQFITSLAQRYLIESLYLPKVEQPAGIIGEVSSSASKTVATLAGAYELPQLSSSSTSEGLESRDTYPFFGRTIPTNAADAKALCIYFQSLGVTHFGVVYSKGDYGTAFWADIRMEAESRNMVVKGMPFVGDSDSTKTAVEQMAATQFRYFFGIITYNEYRDLFLQAKEVGIIGNPDYVWVLSEAAVESFQEEIALDPIEDADLLTAINGIGYIILDIPESEELYTALSELTEQPVLLQEMISVHDDPFAFEHFDLIGTTVISSQYHIQNYDAMMAMGFAICMADQEFPTGPQIFHSLTRNVKFQGESGNVDLDNVTGSRVLEGLKYAVYNVLVKRDESVTNHTHLNIIQSALVNFVGAGAVEHVFPFVYSNGATVPPLSLPPRNENLNLIPTGIRAFGFSLFILASFTSIGWATFTIKYKKKPIVRASQPFFLCMTCVGAFIMGLSILMSGFQEPMPINVLNFACVANLWFFSIGFVTAYSAIFCKMWRLNQVNYKGNRFRRVVVRPKDVLYPFAILMSANIAILTAWTIVDPLRWTRVELANYFDIFDRPSDSVAYCRGSDSTTSYFIFMYVGINVVALIFANYQSYVARKYPSAYNEGYYIALSVGFLLEACLLGIPVIYLVKDTPSQVFLVKSIFITMLCLLILLPLFIPKYLARNEMEMKEPTRHVSNHVPPNSTFPSLTRRSLGRLRLSQCSLGGGSDSGHRFKDNFPDVTPREANNTSIDHNNVRGDAIAL